MMRDIAISALEEDTASIPGRGEYLRDLIVVLIQKEVRLRYRNTWLGYAWSLLHPLTFTAVYFLAFGVIMRVPIENYLVFLIVGLFPWQWISQSLSTAPNVFLANAMLIKKVHFPRNLLVLSVIANLGIQVLLSVPFMILVTIWYGYPASFAWLLGIPLLVAIQFATLYGLSLAIASANVYFRDLDRLVSLAVTFLFVLTPIAYSVQMVPMNYEWLLYLNPLTSVMLGWQQLFLVGVVEWRFISFAAGISFLSVFLGTMIYRRLAARFAEVI